MNMLKKILSVMLLLALLMSVSAYADDDYSMPYYIEVDITNQIVTIYNTSDDSIARQMLTSSGMNGCTPLGTFHLTEKGRLSERSEWTYFQQYNCWVKYATRIYLGYMFHSLPFAEKDMSTMISQHVQEFGMPTSHGCMRLRVEDAEFIAKKCLEGTRVRIFESGEPNEDLRALLLISSFTGEDGMTYQEYLGISDDALGNGSVGDEVLDLQYRLSDLGYYDGELSGKYDVGVIAAIKHLQKDLGLAQTGISSAELLTLIYSDDAPVSSGEITLQEGKSGPAVAKLQTALRQLGLYTGDMDSIYDLDVTEAVRSLQMVCGYAPDGIASPEVQHAAYYLISKIAQELGDENFSCVAETREITLGTVVSEANVNVRQYADIESVVLGKVSDGDTVTVEAIDGDWARISAGENVGYMSADYLRTYTQETAVLSYSSAVTGKTYTPPSADSLESGEKTIAQEIEEYLTKEQFSTYSEETVLLATVNTGSDDVRMNLRAEASTESQVLAEIPNGTSLRVLSQEGNWCYVGYDEQLGYLMSDYLILREGTASEVESTDLDAMIDEDVIKVMAVIVPDQGKKKVSFYDSATEDGEVVYRAEEGEEVEVLLANDETGWVLVSATEKQGYVREENLSFRLM